MKARSNQQLQHLSLLPPPGTIQMGHKLMHEGDVSQLQISIATNT